MFELLDNPTAPTPTSADREAVLRAGRGRLARRRLAVGGSTAGMLLVLGVVALAVGNDETPAVIDAVATTSTSTTGAEAAVPEDASTTTTARAATAAPSTTATSTATSTTTTTVPPRLEPKATYFGQPSVPPRPGVRLTLHLERTSFSATDEVEGTLTLVNGSDEDVTVVTNSCDGVHQGLYRNGEWVGGPEPTKSCPAVVDPVIVAPGQSREFGVFLNGRGFDPRAYEQPPLPPGVYQAGAGVYVSEQKGEPKVAWFAPAVDVEVR